MQNIEDMSIKDRLFPGLIKLIFISAIMAPYIIIAHYFSIHALWPEYLKIDQLTQLLQRIARR